MGGSISGSAVHTKISTPGKLPSYLLSHGNKSSHMKNLYDLVTCKYLLLIEPFMCFFWSSILLINGERLLMTKFSYKMIYFITHRDGTRARWKQEEHLSTPPSLPPNLFSILIPYCHLGKYFPPIPIWYSCRSLVGSPTNKKLYWNQKIIVKWFFFQINVII